MTGVSQEELKKWRGLDSAKTLSVLADHIMQDTTFEPMKRKGTARWHCRAGRFEFELLTNGPKFYDTRAKRGGGGAIDLAMHLFGMNFKSATGQLRRAGL